MLEMRPNCECCGDQLPADQVGAFVCSFECTFCVNCAHNVLHGQCPNCGGMLQPRPTRAGNMLTKYPASDRVIIKSDGCKPSH